MDVAAAPEIVREKDEEAGHQTQLTSTALDSSARETIDGDEPTDEEKIVLRRGECGACSQINSG